MILNLLAQGDIYELFNTTRKGETELDYFEQSLSKEKESLATLKREVVEVIHGNSPFGSVLISELIQTSEQKIIELKDEISRLKNLNSKEHESMIKVRSIQKNLDSFSSLSKNDQQDIIEQLVSRVYIGPEYKYRIEWTFGGYLEG